jgi:predicted NBD/HSP70 family sugar kinase
VSILPGWVGVPAAQLASEHFERPVEVDNDANLGVLAEHTWGAGQGCRDLAYLKLSDGVGAGLFLDGRLYRGRNGTAGEIGHTTFDEFGTVCRCGNRGCLETIVAARCVIDLLESRFGPGLTIADVVGRAQAGDTACARVLSDTGRQAGVAVANLCNLFNPERILIGGELALAGELILAPMRESVRRCGIPSSTQDLTIELAALGSRGPVLGALALALHHAPAHVA